MTPKRPSAGFGFRARAIVSLASVGYRRVRLARLGGLILVVIGLSAVTTDEALALPFTAFDPRSLAMGGTGVASGTSGNASFYNPALLGAPFKDDHFSLELPVVQAEYYDPDNLVKAAKDFRNADYVNAFSNAVATYNSSPTTANGTAVVDSARNLISGLNSISDKALQLDGNVAFVVAKPGRRLGMSLYFNAWVVGGGVGHFSSNDRNLINNVISDVTSGNTQVVDPTNLLTSTVEARLALIGELGVSMARQIRIYGQSLSVGITPKYVRVQTYDYLFKGQQLDNAKISLGQGRRIDSNLNLDIGFAKEFSHGWRTGFTVKNLVPQTYTTALNNTLKVSPQARVGVAHHNSWSTVSADLDLTENDPVGFDSKTRYLGIGAEFNAWSFAQLRLGYRYNMAASKTSIFTGGIGLSPFGVHMDLAVAGNAHEVAAALQTGYRF